MPDPGRAGKGAAKDRSGQGAMKGDKKAARQRSALEAELAKADKVVAKRTAQLESAKTDRAAIRARLAKLTAAASEGAGADGPMAYCLRDRTRVLIVDPKAVVLAGGRKGVAGTCPSCGSKLVRLGAP